MIKSVYPSNVDGLLQEDKNLFTDSSAHDCFGIANRLLELAEAIKDSSLIMEARRCNRGNLTSGGCSEALEHLEQATALCRTHPN
jgi:hypothetical protein